MTDIPVPEVLNAELAGRPGRFDFRAQTPGEFRAWQNEFRATLKDILGLTQMEQMEPVAADARCTEDVSCEGYRRQKWSIATEAGVRVPFYLLLPPGGAGRRPVALALHGHGPGKVAPVGITPATDEPGDRDGDYAVRAVREGYIALAPDLRGFGELMRPEDVARGRQWGCRTLQMHALFFGRCLIGERVWDVSRLVDWLLTREEVDPDRIVVTGNSGGGMITLFAAACDVRIAAAVPSCYFCTFADSILAINHCECNYVPGMLALGEMWNVGGLVAPRPMLVVAGKEDDIFPIAGVEKSYARLAGIYGVADAMDNLEKFIGNGGHRYYAEPVWPFLARKLGSPE